MKIPLGPDSRWWGHTLEHRVLSYLLSLAVQQGKKRGQVKVSTNRLVNDCTWETPDRVYCSILSALVNLHEAGEIDTPSDLSEPELTFQLLKYDDYADPRKAPAERCPDADRLLKLWEEVIGPVPRRSVQQRILRHLLTKDSKIDSSITPENVESVIRWLPSQTLPPDDPWRGWGWVCKTPKKLKEHWSSLLKTNGAYGVWESYVDAHTARQDREALSQAISKQAAEAFDGYEA